MATTPLVGPEIEDVVQEDICGVPLVRLLLLAALKDASPQPQPNERRIRGSAILRARLDGGIRNKAARGELRRGLPVGFVWGEEDGEILIHPDEAVAHAIRTVFARFAELGSARRVWLWFREQGMKFPLRLGARTELRWGEASYHAIHGVPARSMPAPMFMAERMARRYWTRRARGASGCASCQWKTGKF
ncbi:hypothetical protein NKH71_32370 [Mesorhizobium sp. M0983]|uniref:hypothetical protein n=1 Tax=Mesorhizobium sp. M0983 TaxID=2957040 RepID=UPI00333CC509